MNKNGEQPKENNASHANKLPPEIVGRFLQKLSIGDRLKGDRVSPRWEWALSKWGWIEQRKLDADIVFEGANDENIARFWEILEDGSCHLVSLLHKCSPWLRELDFHSFGGENIGRFFQQILGSLQHLQKLEKLDIRGLHLRDFVDHLPNTLRELKSSGEITVEFETLQALSLRCPNMEDVPFEDFINDRDKQHLGAEVMIELFRRFPRQKKLNLFHFPLFSGNQGALASLGQLEALVELKLACCHSLDDRSLRAIIRGCQQLRSLSFNTSHLAGSALLQLANIPKLTALEVVEHLNDVFTDSVLNAIAKRGQLKKLTVYIHKSRKSLTDASILYLVDRCKITERSVEAIIAEVRRRHGTPPRTLPTDGEDPGIFYINCPSIPGRRIRQLNGNNPWLRTGIDHRQII